MSDFDRIEEQRDQTAGLAYEEWREQKRGDGYRPLDGHDAGDGEETCDHDGCVEQPEYVSLTDGAWLCEEHAQ